MEKMCPQDGFGWVHSLLRGYSEGRRVESHLGSKGGGTGRTELGNAWEGGVLQFLTTLAGREGLQVKRLNKIRGGGPGRGSSKKESLIGRTRGVIIRATKSGDGSNSYLEGTALSGGTSKSGPEENGEIGTWLSGGSRLSQSSATGLRS